MDTDNSNIVNIILEDDTEILGNGQGHVAYREYLPIMKYLSILNSYSIKSSFFVDMAHLLFLKKNKDFKDFKIQANLLEQTISTLIKHNMDIQLHIHSQWHNAKIADNKINVSNKWSISQLEPNQQKELFSNCYNLLNSIILKQNFKHKLSAFKAGSWGLQPFNILFNECYNKNINLIFGPSKELKIPKCGIDYTSMENALFPYYCNELNINKIGINKKIVVIPLTPTYLNWIDLFRYCISKCIKDLIFKNQTDLDIIDADFLHKLQLKNPMKNMHHIKASFKPISTHLKINSLPFWYLKKTFNRSYKKVINSKNNYNLIVIETHSKNFKNNFKDINRFFKYIINKYQNIRFITVGDLKKDIENGNLLPTINH